MVLVMVATGTDIDDPEISAGLCPLCPVAARCDKVTSSDGALQEKLLRLTRALLLGIRAREIERCGDTSAISEWRI